MKELAGHDGFIEIAHDALDAAVANLKRPGYRAGLVVTMLTTAWFARNNARPLPSVIIALMAGKVATDLYEKLERIAGKLDPPQLLFHHGAGCPGHTTGKPAECCMAESDAPGQV